MKTTLGDVATAAMAGAAVALDPQLVMMLLAFAIQALSFVREAYARRHDLVLRQLDDDT